MRNLNWRSAFRRASVFTLIWLGIVYVTSVLWPRRFGIEIPEELPFLAINAVFFFVIFALFSAFTESRRERHQQQQKQKSAAKSSASKTQPEEDEGGPLKGQPNPNTSRKKAARKRR